MPRRNIKLYCEPVYHVGQESPGKFLFLSLYGSPQDPSELVRRHADANTDFIWKVKSEVVEEREYQIYFRSNHTPHTRRVFNEEYYTRSEAFCTRNRLANSNPDFVFSVVKEGTICNADPD